MDVEELAPDVRPAGGLGDPVASEQLVKAGIAVGVDDAGERLQMGPRMLALAVGRERNSAAGGRAPANGRSSRT